MYYPQNPQLSAHILASLAINPQSIEFICFCIESYFGRLLSAPMETLISYGIRPVVAPMAAETALQRVDDVNYSIGWIHALIADDPEAAKLALRAIATYAHHYSRKPLNRLKNEVGEQAMQIHTVSKQLTSLLSDQLYEPAN